MMTKITNKTLKQVKAEFNNLGVVNFATLEFIYKNHLGAKTLPARVLDMLEHMNNVLGDEIELFKE
jgi:hypothetical protein